jgi:hypothetical protein
MKSRAVSSFWRGYNLLPEEIQKSALKQYRLWLENPRQPSLHFKKIGLYWSARVTEDYRALGIIAVMEQDTILWFFIGTHIEYNRLLKKK